MERVGRIRIIKTSTLPRTIYRFTAVPIKIPVAFFIVKEKNHPKLSMEPQKTQMAKVICREEEQSWRQQARWLQAILQSYSNQNSTAPGSKQTHRSMEQNREPISKPATCIWSVKFWQEYTKNAQGEKDSLFSKWWCEHWISTRESMKLDRYLNTIQNINSKRVKDLTMRPETVKRKKTSEVSLTWIVAMIF